MTNNGKRLITLMLAGTIATSGAFGLSGCAEYITFVADSTERKSLAIDMSLDANKKIVNVVNYSLEPNDNKYYIKFFAHYNNGTETLTTRPVTYKYVDHKDYTVTYEISKDEYKAVAMFDNNAVVNIKDIPTREQIEVLQSIIDNHDPISVEENTIEENTSTLEHSK